MKMQISDIICPIGYAENNTKDGFIFAFLTSTIIPLKSELDRIRSFNVLDNITAFTNLITAVIDNDICGLNLSPRTILVKY